MISNFHTHTYLCGHAEGHVEDYVAQASLEQCRALGFSDHCPYPNDNRDTWPNIRMTTSLAPMYIADIRRSAKNASFPIYAGFECEWDEYYSNWYTNTLRSDFGADYLVLGSHWLTKKQDGMVVHKYVPNIETLEEFHDYITQTIEGMSTGFFAFLAHPDLPLGKGLIWEDSVAKEFERLVDAAVKYNMPLEINGLGMHKPMVRKPDASMRYPYPVEEFWKMAKEKNAKIICNSDAHSPDVVLDFARDARRFAASLQITPTELF